MLVTVDNMSCFMLSAVDWMASFHNDTQAERCEGSEEMGCHWEEHFRKEEALFNEALDFCLLVCFFMWFRHSK